MKHYFVTTLLVLLTLLACKRTEQNHKSVFVKQLEAIRVADSVLLYNLPSTFQDYYALCGAIDSPLYNYPDIIEHLLHSQQIDYELFIKRVTDISVQAFPDVDHIGFLKDAMTSLLNSNLDLVVCHLNSKTSSENIHFWSFIFGGCEGQAQIEEKEEIKKRVYKLRTWNNPGYEFINTIDTGYIESAKYIIQH